ncbi:MAG: AraC family transcriptional regulator [Bdellovibrionales bacterium]|nr:AraC family transcriptional regulator [Bdellovibrionales bacterium]
MHPEIRHQVISDSYKSDMLFLETDLIFFQRNDQRKVLSNELDAFPRLWSLGIAEVTPDLIGVHRHGETLRKSGLWAAFIPPFSLINWEIAPSPFRWKAYLSHSELPSDLPEEPILFPWNDLWQPKTKAEIFEKVRSIKNYIHIGKEESLNSTAIQTREYINKNFQSPKKFAEIANELNFSHSIMARSFKKSYGLSPIAYRNKLRVFESLTHLLFSQNTVVDTGQLVGFGDTSRFNKQFRNQLNAVPSQFIPKKKHGKST